MTTRPLTAFAVGSVLAIGLGPAGAFGLADLGTSAARNGSLLFGGIWGVAAAVAVSLFLVRRPAVQLALAVGLVAGALATAAFWVKNGFDPLAGAELLFAGALAAALGTAIALVLGAAAGRPLS